MVEDELEHVPPEEKSNAKVREDGLRFRRVSPLAGPTMATNGGWASMATSGTSGHVRRTGGEQ
jgi:hypothetical protein